MVDLSLVQMFVCLYVQLGESVHCCPYFTLCVCDLILVSVFYVYCVLFMGSQICLENK